MKTNRFRLGLFAILVAYSLLYIATTKPKKCDDLCQDFNDACNLIRRDRPYVTQAFHCWDSTLCMYVMDSSQNNWNALADTACMYLKFHSINGFRIIIINQNQDTLADKNCQ